MLLGLQSWSIRKKLRAAQRLGEIADRQAVPALLGLLQDPNATVRQVCLGALVRIGAPAAPGLCNALRVGSAHVEMRNLIRDALIRIGAPAVPGLCGLMEHPAWAVRTQAALALGEIGDPRALECLCAALRDESQWVRWRAAGALNRLGDPEAALPLCGALKDESHLVRLLAARALTRLGDGRCVAALRECLMDEAGDVRLQAVLALARLGRPAVMPLVQALDDRDGNIRLEAAWALARIADDHPLQELRAAVPRLRRLIAQSWADPRGKRSLQAALNRIEARVGTEHNLPIPASASAAAPADLPLPAGAPSRDLTDLPLPDNSAREPERTAHDHLV